MPQPAGPDHDQRLKVLLEEFFEQFFLCFFPAWAMRFEFTASGRRSSVDLRTPGRKVPNNPSLSSRRKLS